MAETPIDSDQHVPALLGFIDSHYGNRTAALLRDQFDLTPADGRAMLVIGAEPGVAATRITALTGLDKAVVSRTVQALSSKGLIAVKPDPNHVRRQQLTLTWAGLALHDRLVRAARSREALLLAGLSDIERNLLVSLLHKLQAQLPAANAWTPES